MLGLIALVILYAKLYTLNFDWDDEPPQDVVNMWKTYLKELLAIQKLRLSPHSGVLKNSKILIIAFSDASERVYSCVIYIRLRIILFRRRLCGQFVPNLKLLH